MKNKLVLKCNTSLEEAISLLDIGGIGFLPVVDEGNFLIGILTDGDLRRAFLNKKLTLNDIINKNPITYNYTLPKKQAIQFLKSIHRRHLPLVDDQKRLVDIITLDDLDFNLKTNKVVIMGGGLGSRLGTLTHNTPKPMLPIGGKPILELLLDTFINYGFNDFYISVNYKSDIIKNHFGNGDKMGVSIRYLEEKTRLGTAGALSLLAQKFDESLIVINGDILTSLNFEELLNYHNAKNSFATMVVKELEHEFPYGIVELKQDRIISLKEKPIQKFFINSGIYVLNPEVLKYVPTESFFNMTDLFDVLIKQDKEVFNYVINDYWLDIGQLKDYETAQNNYKA